MRPSRRPSSLRGRWISRDRWPGLWQSARRSRRVCGTGRGPALPGCGHTVTRFWRAAASWRSRLRPRRPARPHEPPLTFRARPHLLDPPGHRVVVPLRRPPGRDLAGPAVAHQQPAHARDRACQVEAPADPVLTRPRVQRWSFQPCAAGPFANSASNWANCLPPGLGSDAGPCDRKDRKERGPPSARA